MFKKAFFLTRPTPARRGAHSRFGRSEQEGDTYVSGTLSPQSDKRTKLEAFFNILDKPP
jgi:hypothetical protein